MTAYVNSLIAVMIVCQIVSTAVPNTEYAGRYIRMICALTALLTFLSPIQQLASSAGELTDAVTAFFAEETAPDDEKTEAGAAELIQYIMRNYRTDELTVVIVTDETDTEITEIGLYVPDCPYTLRTRMERELGELLGLPVTVNGTRKEG